MNQSLIKVNGFFFAMAQFLKSSSSGQILYGIDHLLVKVLI